MVQSLPMRLLRKLIHLAMAWLPALGWLISFQIELALAAILLLASLIVEIARRQWHWVNRLLWRALPSTFRPDEERQVLGSTWFVVGMLGALVLFGRDTGGTAVLFLAWGDPAAELAGRRWGRPGRRKTLAGSLGCLAACLLAACVGMGLAGLSPVAALAGAVVATLTERWSPPPNDNVWLPILTGLAMWVAQRLI
jgi:dolichol kinase